MRVSVEVDLGLYLRRKITPLQVNLWLEENFDADAYRLVDQTWIGGAIEMTFWFVNENDAVLFKMRWG
jgi:hypothetical protein